MIPSYLTKEMKIYPQETVYGNVDSCFAPNSETLETTQMYLKGKSANKLWSIHSTQYWIPIKKKDLQMHTKSIDEPQKHGKRRIHQKQVKLYT